MSSLTVATLFPWSTIAAGDEANAASLVRRATALGVAARAVVVAVPSAMVDADVYLLGGTGRTGTATLVDQLRAADLAARVRAGAVVLAVDAGFDALCHAWVDPEGRSQQGLGLLDVRIAPGPTVTDTVVTRAVDSLPAMVGWLSQDTRTIRAPGVQPLCLIERGQAIAGLDPDGVLADRVVATRLHGPVLALNPELADLVLDRVVPGLPRVAIPPAAAQARQRRIDEVRGAGPPRRRRLRRP